MSFEMFFGASPRFCDLVEIIDRYAGSHWPVLILGETGVGKELIARRVHAKSSRAQASFVPVNCGAIPAGLFESELFGHERGAFSGATQASRGLARQAHGGTLFLDEIGELDINLQVKLLRLLDLGEIRAVGSQRCEQVSVRVIAATNVALPLAVKQGRFRQDLWERLSVLTADVPPLRQRLEDIPLIARHLLKALGCSFTEDSLVPLSGFDWPGNVRQLRNILIRAQVLGSGNLTRRLVEQLIKDEISREGSSFQESAEGLEGSLADIEKQVIVDRLKRCGGNRRKAARELGIAKSTLHDKIRKWKDGAHDVRWPLACRVANPELSS